jgi:hypothetical protein
MEAAMKETYELSLEDYRKQYDENMKKLLK